MLHTDKALPRTESRRRRTATDRGHDVPGELRDALRLVRASRRPLGIAWGTPWRLLANEAFASLVGLHVIDAPGRTLQDMCPELACWLEPLLQAALGEREWAAADDKLFCVYRNRHAEETYLTASCSRVTGNSADCPGVLVSITETTEHILGARRAAALRDVAAEAFGSGGVTESCARALAAVSRHPEEIPFALLYLRDNPALARLMATAHLGTPAAARPECIPLGEHDEPRSWPVAQALSRNETVLVDDVLDRFGPLPAGGWPFAPRYALVVPVTCPGGSEPDGAVVVGVSARRAPDAEHRAFVELVVQQIGAAVAGGRLHEAAEARAASEAEARRRDARRRARVRARERALKARFVGALEERTRLAREIHDTLLQGVTAVAVQLRVVLPHLDPPPASAASLERILALAERTSHEARQAVWDMRPRLRTADEFARALEAAVARIVEGSKLSVRSSVTGRARRLSSEQQDVVLRVAQEAIANVIRHAGASVLRVRLAYGARRVTLTVADNGAGFIVKNDPRSYGGHWGLLGMCERAESVDGALHVRSGRGTGTTIQLVLPHRRRARLETPRA